MHYVLLFRKTKDTENYVIHLLRNLSRAIEGPNELSREMVYVIKQKNITDI
jgi:hypothetical protein